MMGSRNHVVMNVLAIAAKPSPQHIGAELGGREQPRENDDVESRTPPKRCWRQN